MIRQTLMRTTTWLRLVVATACVAAVWPLVGRAQVPKFRSGVDLVYLDVSVLDRDRKPMRGLTADDFELFEDGKPQVVSTFSAVDIPDAVEPSTPWMREVAPDTQRNDTLNDRRLFVMVIDDATAQVDVAALKSTKAIAKRFIEKMGPTDLMSIVFTLNNRNAQEYTSDRAKLFRAVDKFNVGFRDLGDNTLYFRYTIETLGKVAEFMTALPQQRKALVYVGQGVPVDAAAASQVTMAGTLGALEAGAAQQMLVHRMREAFHKAQRANVTFYTLDTCGLRSPMKPTCAPGLEVDFLRGIAQETGGYSSADSNEFESGITQIYRENSSYYLLGFQSTNPTADGKFRRIEVKVKRPGAEVRSRSGYTAPKPVGESSKKAEEEPSPLALAISGLLPKGDVPMQVWAAPFAIAGRRDPVVPIVIALRQDLAARETRMTETIDVRVDAYSPEGRLKTGHTLKAQVALRPGPGGEAAYEVLSMLSLQPGRYQLRLGTMLLSQRTSGSVYVDVDVPDFTKGPLVWSGIAFHATPAVTMAGAAINTGLPFVPTTQRLFQTSDRVTAFARIQQGGKKPLLPVLVHSSVTDSTGTAVWQRNETFEVVRFDAARGADVRLNVPVAQLKSGPYRLRVDATVGDVTVTKDSRFTVR
jgi:VWFA-related protein